MSHRLILWPEAESDVAAAAEWYELQRSGLSLQFRDALDKTFAAIQERPSLHTLVYRDLRRAFVAFLSAFSMLPNPTALSWLRFSIPRVILACGVPVSSLATANLTVNRTRRHTV